MSLRADDGNWRLDNRHFPVQSVSYNKFYAQRKLGLCLLHNHRYIGLFSYLWTIYSSMLFGTETYEK